MTEFKKLHDRTLRFETSIIENKYDQLYKERQARRTTYKPPIPLLGTCRDMCPEFERYERELHMDLSIFEMVYIVYIVFTLLYFIDFWYRASNTSW